MIILPQEMKWQILLYAELKDFPELFAIDSSWFEVQKNDNFWKEVCFRDKNSTKKAIIEIERKTFNRTFKEIFRELVDVDHGFKRLSRIEMYSSKLTKKMKKKKEGFIRTLLFPNINHSFNFIQNYDFEPLSIAKTYCEGRNTIKGNYFSAKLADLRKEDCRLSHQLEIYSKKDLITLNRYQKYHGFVLAFNRGAMSGENEIQRYMSNLELFWKELKEFSRKDFVSILLGFGEKSQEKDEKAQKWAISKGIKFFSIQRKKFHWTNNMDTEKQIWSSLNYLLRMSVIKNPLPDEFIIINQIQPKKEKTKYPKKCVLQ